MGEAGVAVGQAEGRAGGEVVVAEGFTGEGEEKISEDKGDKGGWTRCRL